MRSSIRRRHTERRPRVVRTVLVLFAIVCGSILTLVSGDDAPVSAAPSPSTKALVLYDSTGPWAFLGDVYAQQTANLAGHFGSVTTKKVTAYTAGEVNNYTAAIYIGSTYDEPLPAAFLSDVATTTKPVVWAGSNIWQLTARNPNFIYDYGWMWGGFDPAVVRTVSYKGIDFDRSSLDGGGIMNYYSVDTTKATELATAKRDDGTTFPWAVRSKNLTYVGEIPYTYINERDRYLIWCDLLFDALAPQTPERHRAMIRLEDVGPESDPAQLRQIADYLYSKRIPFSVATYTQYRDPLGTYNNGKAESKNLSLFSPVAAALRYMDARGGTIIQHGRTHQFEKLINPYSGTSADDFEFYTAHVDPNDAVILDGPVPGDSQRWASSRIAAGRRDFLLSAVNVAKIFEFPHYAASVADYKAVKQLGLTGYDRRLYFPGYLSGGAIDYTRPTGQFFPYDVVDVYGTKVLPENLGNYEALPYNQHPATLIPELVDRARLNLGVRDGFASVFYHPTNGLAPLQQFVEGINALGKYQWVSAGSL